jgi:hypothetical protein
MTTAGCWPSSPTWSTAPPRRSCRPPWCRRGARTGTATRPSPADAAAGQLGLVYDADGSLDGVDNVTGTDGGSAGLGGITYEMSGPFRR